MKTRLRSLSGRITRGEATHLATALLLSVSVMSTIASVGATDMTWDVLQQQGRVLTGSVLPPEPGAPFHILRITGGAGEPARTVLTIERPAIKGPHYALVGQVKYEDIEGVGYLELWNHFPGGGQYFSRTLADAGPMMKLHGTSGWRRFALPFDATGAPQPIKLVFNVVLPGGGVVFLGPLQLVDGPLSADLTRDAIDGR